MHARTIRRNFLAALTIGGAALAGVIASGGCASYANLPGPDSATGAVQNPNARQPRAVMAKAFEVATRVYPAGGEGATFAIDLPEGLTDQSIAWIMSKQSPSASVSTGDMGVPTYRLGRVWIRSGKAKVDVFRPVIELPRRADGTYQHQAITVWLEGGLDPWRVTRLQKWAIGAFPRPGVVDSYGTEDGGDTWNDPDPEYSHEGEGAMPGATQDAEDMNWDPRWDDQPDAPELDTPPPAQDAPTSWRTETPPAEAPRQTQPSPAPASDHPWLKVEPIGGG